MYCSCCEEVSRGKVGYDVQTLQDLNVLHHDIESLARITDDIKRIQDNGIHYDSDIRISHEDFQSDEIFMQVMNSLKPVIESIMNDLNFKFEKA